MGEIGQIFKICPICLRKMTNHAIFNPYIQSYTKVVFPPSANFKSYAALEASTLTFGYEPDIKVLTNGAETYLKFAVGAIKLPLFFKKLKQT
jgi:hypothetical protein